jgi:DNA-binding NarL/FixJ family response regulator
MKFLLVDDHILFREGIKYILQRYAQKVQILEASSYSDACQIAKEQNNFDLVLLNLAEPDIHEFDAIDQIKNYLAKTPLVIVSACEDPKVIREILSMGIQGYIPTSYSSQVMFCAIQLVLSGGVYVPPLVLTQPATFKEETQPETTAEIGELELSLTPRQRQVLNLLSKGKTNKEIGQELGLSEATIRTHLCGIFKLLKVSNRTQAVHVASREGILKST